MRWRSPCRLLALGLVPGLALATACARSAPVQPERLAEAIGRAQAVAEGTGGPLVYAFVDPLCAACLNLRVRLRPLIEAGRLKVRWIPVQTWANSGPASQAVRANTALLALLLSGAVATPTLAYRAAQAGLRVQVGTPEDPIGLLREAR